METVAPGYGAYRVRSDDRARLAGLSRVDVHARAAARDDALHRRDVRKLLDEELAEQVASARAVVKLCPSPSGTSTCSPDCPDVFGKLGRPIASRCSCSRFARVIACVSYDCFTSKSIVKKSACSSFGSRHARMWSGMHARFAM